MNNKPFSQACENNKAPILAVLSAVLADCRQVLEVGSGSGQHAVFFAAHLPHLCWQTSDIVSNHCGINQWIDESLSKNLQRPIVLDLHQPWQLPFESNSLDAIYSANTLHIVAWPLVEKFFQGVKEHLTQNGILCIYGPFNYNGEFTSDSNAKFDLWLKQRDADSGIRDIEAIIHLAEQAQLHLLDDVAMPANNRLLTFKKQ